MTRPQLAELHRRLGEPQRAREFLDDVWVLAERGPYRLEHAEAYNILTQLERDVEDSVAASKAANSAYYLAWCDGPPFAYYQGLQRAKAHLAALREMEPSLPPFDEATQRSRLDFKIESLDKLNH